MIIALVGPTGVGKSKLALKVCQSINGCIVNCDAFQIYKYMDIGTAKPTKEERSLVEHHLFDYVEPNQEFSVYDYQVALRNKIDELTKMNKPIILVGGTGLYLKAALYDFSLKKEDNKVDMSKYQEMSNQELHQILEKIDYEESLKIHQNNRKRVLRAIEIYLTQGEKKSEIVSSQQHKLLYDVVFVGLTKQRDELYDLINKRVDIMFEDGLVDEVKSLSEKYGDTPRAFQAIGYKEIIEGLKQKKNIEEIKDLIKKNSRHYAKRQYTYFNHQLDVNWFSDVEKAYSFILEKMR